MATITTLLGDMDEALLVKSEVCVDNDNERTTVVEYCLRGCDGQWHRTHEPDRPGVFCAQHVHRSINIELKVGVAALSSVGSF